MVAFEIFVLIIKMTVTRSLPTRSIRFLLFSVLVALIIGNLGYTVSAFVPVLQRSIGNRNLRSRMPGKRDHRRPTPFVQRRHDTRLHYLDEEKQEPPPPSTSFTPTPQDQQQQTSSTTSSSSLGLAPTIPVIGPFWTKPPLMVGAELRLGSLTPMQWQALEESFYLHQQHIQHDNASVDGDGASSHPPTVGISAAPLIAILDDVTLPTSAFSSIPPGCRYATIAAIVGISPPSERDNVMSPSLIKSLGSTGQSDYHRDGTTSYAVRFVGVGRAMIRNFSYQVPYVLRNAEDEEGHLLDANGKPIVQSWDQQTTKNDADTNMDINNNNNNQSSEDGRQQHGQKQDEVADEEEDDDDTPYPASNVIMAEFHLLQDRPHKGGGVSGNAYTSTASPIHALNEMARVARQVEWVHQDRRKLVQGIRAAQVRLQRANARPQNVDPYLTDEESGSDRSSTHKLKASEECMIEDDLQDYDGLGAIFGFSMVPSPSVDSNPVTVLSKDCTILNTDPTKESGGATASGSNDNGSYDASGPLDELDNYGMGSSATAMVGIQEMATVWMEKLLPYYSPTKRASEEHYYEMLSFVAVVAVQDILEKADLAWALRCTNTAERLERVYHWMRTHVDLLREETFRIRSALEACGEECSDLFD